MSHNFDLDKAVNYLTVIVQQIRCPICDKGHGTRMRYWCGHTACGDCVETASWCVLCLTPPHTETASAGPILDPVLTAQVQHVSELLKSFEDTFGIDVIRRQRVSEQLKIEKYIFPECIQAPLTYGMKHKMADNSLFVGETSKKQKKMILPGELVGSPFVPKMDNTKKNVMDWLDQHESDLFQYQPRRPFSDLEINSPRFYQRSSIKKCSDTILEKAREGNQSKTITKSRKRPKKSTAASVKSEANLGTFLKNAEKGHTSGWKSVKRARKDFDNYDKQEPNYSVITHKNEKEESGMINDHTIVIEDSQIQGEDNLYHSQIEVVDKDRDAWLAVLAAEDITASSIRPTCDQHDLQIPTDKLIKGKQLNTGYHSPSILVTSAAPGDKSYSSDRISDKAPFFKKSYLTTCNASRTKPISTKPKEVSITFKTGSLLTNIKASTRIDTRSFTKTSKSVQTDENDEYDTGSFTKTSKSVQTDENDEYENPNAELKGIASKCPLKIDSKVNNDCSEDLFSGKKQSTFEPEPENMVELNKPVPIIGSGSESENEQPVSLTVTADVHKSMDAVERKVLTEIHNNKSKKPTCSKRGHSPESSNSSDKENRDPNRMKKGRINMKNIKKKRHQIKTTYFKNLF